MNIKAETTTYPCYCYDLAYLLSVTMVLTFCAYKLHTSVLNATTGKKKQLTFLIALTFEAIYFLKYLSNLTPPNNN